MQASMKSTRTMQSMRAKVNIRPLLQKESMHHRLLHTKEAIRSATKETSRRCTKALLRSTKVPATCDGSAQRHQGDPGGNAQRR
mmetsp:Transcript_90443/g.215919  ORF Transcript_90443/g.215919 Transcript_90443/m.215919 type:complete len:84 (-) Transcript_90443:2-253(-)